LSKGHIIAVHYCLTTAKMIKTKKEEIRNDLKI
jgi:hypothetical protein